MHIIKMREPVNGSFFKELENNIAKQLESHSNFLVIPKSCEYEYHEEDGYEYEEGEQLELFSTFSIEYK